MEYILIKDGIVKNIIVVDDTTDAAFLAKMNADYDSVIEKTMDAWIGGTYIDGVFSPPEL